MPGIYEFVRGIFGSVNVYKWIMTFQAVDSFWS